MNNFPLFICGLAVTFISAIGIAVHMINLGYEEEKKYLKEKKKKSQVDLNIDLGNVSEKNAG
jgi:hypothetical protein